MKKFVITGAAVFAFIALTLCRVSAQVTVQVNSDQNQFLSGEAIPLAVKITNMSGQQVHLGVEPDWLTFNVESADGSFVIKKNEVPVQGEFDLETSQLGIKRVDIEPYFIIAKPGRYKITAVLRIKAWGLTVPSASKDIDVVTGAKIWSQNFGVPSAAGVPEMRKFTLEEANHLREQLRLYIQLTDSTESRVFKVAPLGPMVSFGQPEAQIDRQSQLHVLWQTGAQNFSYCVISPDGTLLKRDTYVDFNNRPKLVIDASGDISVVGGVRRNPDSDVPAVLPPVEQLPSAATPK